MKSEQVRLTDTELEALRGHTAGPWNVSGESGRGFDTRFLTNDGQLPVMAPDPDQETKRVVLVDCQSPFKRGQGWQSNCAERDANAALIAAATVLLAEVIERRARDAAVAEALELSVLAMRAPLDDWKGEVERKALDVANAALAALAALRQERAS